MTTPTPNCWCESCRGELSGEHRSLLKAVFDHHDATIPQLATLQAIVDDAEASPRPKHRGRKRLDYDNHISVARTSLYNFSRRARGDELMLRRLCARHGVMFCAEPRLVAHRQ